MMGQNIYHWKEMDKGNPMMYKFMVICEFLCVRSSAARLYDLSRMAGGSHDLCRMPDRSHDASIQTRV